MAWLFVWRGPLWPVWPLHCCHSGDTWWLMVTTSNVISGLSCLITGHHNTEAVSSFVWEMLLRDLKIMKGTDWWGAIQMWWWSPELQRVARVARGRQTSNLDILMTRNICNSNSQISSFDWFGVGSAVCRWPEEEGRRREQRRWLSAAESSQLRPWPRTHNLYQTLKYFQTLTTQIIA